MWTVMAERFDGDVQRIVDCSSRAIAAVTRTDMARKWRTENPGWYVRWWIVRKS